MNKKLLLFVSFIFITTIAIAQQKYHRISAKMSKEDIHSLFEKGLDVDHYQFENGIFKAEVSDNDISVLKANNIKVKYLVRDLEKNIPKINKKIDQKSSKNLRQAATPANFALGSYGGYFSLQEMINILDQMRVQYPNLISVKSSIGNTIEGRPIYMVKISDNPDVDESEPEVFLNAVHHAREPISLSQLIYFMWHVLENYGTDPEITTMLNSSELYLVPVVNPDGYEYNRGTNPNGGGMWRKNRKNNGNGTYGVDINRNYGYMWGLNNTGSSATTSSETYRGTAAFSEPETQAVRNFCNAHDFVASMDFHSYGNYCIYPYGYQSTNTNPELSLFTQLGTYLTAENGFKAGNSLATVGYSVNGAGDDWKYGEQTTKNKIYSFTPEVGTSTDGFYPAQSRILPLCESTLQMNRKILKLSSKFAAISASSITSTSLSGNLSFSLQNFSVRNPTYTVNISTSSPFVASVGSPQLFSNMATFQTSNSLFAYSLSPETPFGTVIDFVITLDNGHSPQQKTVSITYDCAAPSGLAATGITTNAAKVSWTATGDAHKYVVAYKTSASATWSPDQTLDTTYIDLTGLTPQTFYDFRVRDTTCNNQSQISFTTQAICGIPANLSIGTITSTTANVSWQAASGATSYKVEYKLATATTWTVANAAQTALTQSLGSLTASSTYNVRISSNCTSGTSGYLSGQFTTAAPPAVTYCASKGSNSSLMWVDYFKLSNLTRTSGNDGGYYNGTSSTINLSKNTTYTLTYSAGYSSTKYRVYWKAWIDYNNNGSFNDSGEQILNANSTGTGNYTVSFKVPTTAKSGQTRIRIAMKYNATPTSCETFSYGEVEDFTISIPTTANNSNARIGEELIVAVAEQVLMPTIFPNPVSEILTIDLKESSAEAMNLEVFNAQGRKMFSEIVEPNALTHHLNVSKLLPGNYTVSILGKEKISSIHFIKQ
ncbi:MAG: fibronectin type III domain-containing protein [Cytophagaceae bacterium]|nr:fibronectin type III domain-containing protein [Cytophagaceae bacterium]